MRARRPRSQCVFACQRSVVHPDAGGCATYLFERLVRTSTTPCRGPPQTTAARAGAPESSKQRLGHRGLDKHHAVPQRGVPGAQPPKKISPPLNSAPRPNAAACPPPEHRREQICPHPGQPPSRSARSATGRNPARNGGRTHREPRWAAAPMAAAPMAAAPMAAAKLGRAGRDWVWEGAPGLGRATPASSSRRPGPLAERAAPTPPLGASR